MSSRSQRWRAGLLFLVFVLGLLPGCSPANEPDRSHDDAMLLMIASHVRLAESLEGEPQASAHGQMSVRPVGIMAQGGSINEVTSLIELYRKYEDTLESQKGQYTDHQYDFVQGTLINKISDLEQKANSLTQRRRRRPFNPFKVIGRGIGKLAKGIGKGVKFVVVEGGKLAIHYVVNKVKTTVRDVFEGRITSIIARFASRFGPMSPWVEARLRRVLDRWWVGFRDRATGRAERYATQTAEAIAKDGEREDDTPREDQGWFDQAWPGLKALLVDEQRNCQTSAIFQWRDCLRDQAAFGASEAEATETCQSTYDAIPNNDAGGTVTIAGEVNYGGAVANEASITYPSGGGAVSGSFYYQIYDHVFDCTITVTTTGVVGQYDLETCSMSGTANMKLTYEGMTCVSVCGPTENSPAPCPVIIEGPTTWDATLDEGVLSGGVGGDECEPHCFGFRAPGYGIAP
ncbi:MAG: hypothetical protein V3S81_09425 [Anaerolineales bacterium]